MRSCHAGGGRGASVVIDVTNTSTINRKKAESFFATVTGNLLTAGRRVGVRHHVVLSVVGVDRVGFGYYAGKRRQEALVLDGAVPATVLRSTQFYEFAAQLVATRGPIAAVPQMLCQPVAAREVARCLVDLAVASPAGLAPDIAGPQRLSMPDMARRLLRARGSHRVVVAVRLPGATGRAMAGGGLLPTGRGPRGEETFEQWLASPAARSTTRPARCDEGSRPSPPRGGSGQETTDGGLR